MEFSQIEPILLQKIFIIMKIIKYCNHDGTPCGTIAKKLTEDLRTENAYAILFALPAYLPANFFVLIVQTN